MAYAVTQRPKSRARKIFFGVLIFLLVVLIGAGAAAVFVLRGSLPKLNGEVTLPGLSASVTVERDELGIVTIRAKNQADASRALGYVHAQEQYFEMDLVRRSSAGELAELVGASAVSADEAVRVHRMRARVEANLDAFVGNYAEEMQAYVDGANAGLGALATQPWPYLLLGQAPKPWTMVDSALAGYALYFDLQADLNDIELEAWRLKQVLPAELYEFLAHEGTRFDAPLFGEGFGHAVIPSADELDYRTQAPGERTTAQLLSDSVVLGSNNFAVGKEATEDGRAILAGDMHLGLRAPNIWFRVRLVYDDPAAPNGKVDISGVSLPGMPAIISGSNGRVAWAFTNGYADTSDYMYYEDCAANAECAGATIYTETIQVKDEQQTFEIAETEWGPIVHRTADGGALAVRWTAHQPGAITTGLMDFVRATDLDNLFELADGAAVPIQNMLAADRNGRIGWRILGALPDRAEGCSLGDIDLVYTPDMDCAPWEIRTDISPQIKDPEDGRLWTANSRVIGGEDYDRFGTGAYALASRSWQIREGLNAKQTLTERDLLAIQLDDEAVLMADWYEILRETVVGNSDTTLQKIADATAVWGGHASTDSVSYRITKDFRLEVQSLLYRGLVSPYVTGTDVAGLELGLASHEGWAWPLVTERPEHMLPAAYASWNDLFETAAKESLKRREADGVDVYSVTWGEVNKAAICHPIAAALPSQLASLLCMPADELAGDSDVPRVARPTSGASQRTIVSPGLEAQGIMHMPGGQSGHILSPFWGSGHADWVEGNPSAFLAGATKYTLEFRP